MSKISTVLWDIDATLLDFKYAESVGIKASFEKFKLGECTDAMVAEYSAINNIWWERLERGEVTKPEVLRGRFRDFFALHDIDENIIEDFLLEYEGYLAETVRFMDGAMETLNKLKAAGIKQYAVSNGAKVVQSRKLEKSGLDKIFDRIFISEDMGVEKPGVGFFNRIWELTGRPESMDEVMIVGDSLTSDMRGGNNAGIVCCWYNPGGKTNKLDVIVDYDIRSLAEVPEIIKL